MMMMMMNFMVLPSSARENKGNGVALGQELIRHSSRRVTFSVAIRIWILDI